ncbi:MAG TPA: DUF72 domain-containing protein [Gemmatimonadales bacterium]|nr:DUF72 domain-containing protein [Gemmatimonadales bacterium]
MFYPAGLPVREELRWFAQRFRTVELNNPFYRLPESATFRRWREAVPPDFLFAVKASRFITHHRRLADPAQPLGLLLERAAELGSALGPILFQLPPTFQLDLARLDGFLEVLPAEHRWTVEFRHPSWHRPEVYDRLGSRGIALCVPVGGRVWPDLVTTASFAYVRMHAGAAPGGGFADDQLRAWAGRIRGLRRAGKEVFVYFNNDMEGHAVRDAARLRVLLRLAR